jgi:transcriptional regulator with XRE-family HTH domain
MNVAVAVPDDLTVEPIELEEAMAVAGVHASALARRLRVDVGTVSRWRLGKTVLSRSRFVAVLAVLGLPLDWEPTPGWRPVVEGGVKAGRPRIAKPPKRRAH